MFRTRKSILFTSALVQVAGWAWVVRLQQDDPQSEWAFLGLSVVLGAALWLMWLEGMWSQRPFGERFVRGMSVGVLMGVAMIAGALIGHSLAAL